MEGDRPGEITRLLRRMGAGDGEAREELYKLIYTDLHNQAEVLMRRQNPSHTLQPTALVNEAYLRLASRSGWEDRRHFFGVAAKAMRSVLVDHARARRAAKRGGETEAVPLDELVLPFEDRAGDLVDLDAALEEFAAMDSRAARVVELRFFVGLTCREAAQVLDVSDATVERDWEVAKAWLRGRLR